MGVVREVELLSRVFDHSTHTKRAIASAIGLDLITLRDFIKGTKQLRAPSLNKIKKFLDAESYPQDISLWGTLEWCRFYEEIDRKIG